MTHHDLDTPEGMAEAQAWLTAIINLFEPGGRWTIPGTASTYTFYHDTKTAHRPGWMPDPDTDRVLRAMGWTVSHPD